MNGLWTLQILIRTKFTYVVYFSKMADAPVPDPFVTPTKKWCKAANMNWDCPLEDCSGWINGFCSGSLGPYSQPIWFKCSASPVCSGKFILSKKESACLGCDIPIRTVRHFYTILLSISFMFFYNCIRDSSSGALERIRSGLMLDAWTLYQLSNALSDVASVAIKTSVLRRNRSLGWTTTERQSCCM